MEEAARFERAAPEPVKGCLVRANNVTNLLEGNYEYICGGRAGNVAKRAWKEIVSIFNSYAEYDRLPSAQAWYVLGEYVGELDGLKNLRLLAGTKEPELSLLPYRPPEYIALVSDGSTLVIPSSVRGYRSIYVKALRALARATVYEAGDEGATR